MISSGMNLVMTVIGFAVSILFIVFVCTRLVCARIHLNSSRRSFPIATRSDLSLLERGFHGLEPVVVANFPTKKFSDEFFAATEDAQCSVCLSEYQGEDTLRILPYCGHSFHVTCIDIWLQQHSTCPVCRISLRESPDKKRMLQPLSSLAIRSNYGMESQELNSYSYLLNVHGFSPRALSSNGLDTVQENPFGSEADGAEARENSTPRTDSNNQIMKESGNKHVESPSNP